MRFVNLLTIPVLLGVSALVACSDSSSSDDMPGPGDSSTPDTSVPDTSVPDTSTIPDATPDATPDGPNDSGPDAMACTGDAGAGACCCHGDEGAQLLCGAAGELSCPSGFGLYYGEDCNADHAGGPCALPGPDGGVHPDAGDAGDAAGDAGPAPDAGDAGH